MHRMMPPLNALRAFEAAARHLSLTKAGQELNVTPGALSHQIRALEELLGVKLFERGVRTIALTPAGKQLYPGLRAGFLQIREAVTSFDASRNERVLVISTSPGFTAKWLAPRLYRFAAKHPEIDTRVSSSLSKANFTTDGVDVAVRNMPATASPNPLLATEPLAEVSLIPVCSPRLVEQYGPFDTPAALARAPLIHDETLSGHVDLPNWVDWFRAAGIDGVDLSHGLRFNSADHALDAAVEGAGVLLSHDLIAYDDLRTGRLTIAVKLALPSGRAFHLVWPRSRHLPPRVEAFRNWIREEIAALDRRHITV